jgi:hypothetical protein
VPRYCHGSTAIVDLRFQAAAHSRTGGRQMSRDVERYFSEVVLPFVEARFPDLTAEVMVLIEGSAGLGLHDALSDLDATVYLDDPLWKARGGQLQLALMHELPAFSQRSEPHCSFPGRPHRWAITGHPEVCVHPVSWLLDHNALAFLAPEGPPPWQAVSIERLYAMQHDLVLRDPHGTLRRLREATSVDRCPEWLWRKRLITKLSDLKGEPWDFEKAVKRSKPMEALTILGPLLQALIEISFVLERSYYPWRKHLWQAFGELPIAHEVGPLLAAAATSTSWDERVGAVNEIVTRYADAAIQRGLLSSEMLEFLPQAKGEEAWSNLNWLAEYRKYGPLARDAGFDEQDGWVWGLWRWA